MEDKTLFDRLGEPFIEALADERVNEHRLEFPALRGSGAFFIDYLCMELSNYIRKDTIPEDQLEEFLNNCAIDFGEDFYEWPDLITLLSFREMPIIYWYDMVREMRAAKLIKSDNFCKTILTIANSVIYTVNEMEAV